MTQTPALATPVLLVDAVLPVVDPLVAWACCVAPVAVGTRESIRANAQEARV